MPDTALLNQQFRLAARPVGLPKRDRLAEVSEPVRAAADGEIVVKALYLSLDPAMRGWMNEGKSYIRPVAIGEVMRAGGVGVVVESKSPKFAVGDYVSGGIGVQRYWIGAADDKTASFFKIDPRMAPLTTWLNTLGMPGMTGYFGLIESGQPKAGDTVVVSGAAGAVGMTVGQVAKHLGCRVVGIAGGKDKCDFVVNELGFDACIDYKGGSVKDGLKEHCPKGVDVYFDNVGGDILDTVLTRINDAGAHRHLRRHFAVQQHHPGQGSGQLPVAAGQPRAHGRHRRIRLRRPLPRGRGGDGQVDEGRQLQEQAKTWSTASRPSPKRC
jgi:NADPH-dependent curcumin reductase CurA